MKTTFKTIFLLFFVLVAIKASAEDHVRSRGPLNPEFVQYQQNPAAAAMAPGGQRKTGYIPSPLQVYFEETALKKAANVAFDAVYDLRTSGLVTGVRDQGNCGSCWAFAAYGAMESNWLKNGYGSVNLSENNMKNCHGFVYGACDGGNRDIATSYLARFSGPVRESVDPYADVPETCEPFTPEYVSTDAVFLPKDINILKQAIMDNGALATNMRFEDASYRESDYTHYYNGTSTSTNHGVTLVGWDDAKATASLTPGAWIVKNSWGTEWGDNGYFYVSYNDKCINTSPWYMKGRIPSNSTTSMYSIDKLGAVNSAGYHAKTAYALIKFTGVNNSPLLTVGTWTIYSNTVVSAEVYDTFSDGVLSGLLGTVSGQTCTYPGYYTFSLNAPVPVTSGNDFYIKVRYDISSKGYPVPIERLETGYAVPVIESGRCWTSETGSEWEAMGSDVADAQWDLCINAFASISKIWKGSSTSWNDPSGWLPTGVPGTTHDVLIPFSASSQPVISAGAQADCRNLYNEGTITINSDGSLTGSLIVKGKAFGGGNVKFNRQMRAQASYGDYHYFSSPVVETISDFSTANSSKLSQIWEWQETNAIPWQTLGSGSFVSGKGYNLAQQSGSDGMFVFTGSPVNGAGPLEATAPYATPYVEPYRTPWGGGGWNLLGNPFTSAMDAAAFITTNTASFDPSYLALYIYDGVNNQYQYAASVLPGYPFTGSFGTVVQAGQGFFVLAKQNNVNFSFLPSMQIHSGTTPLKSAHKEEPWAGVLLKVQSGNQEYSTTVVYNEKMITGLDPGFDVGLFSAGQEVEIFTALVSKDNGVNFARQALPPGDASQQVVPVGVDAEKGGVVAFSADVIPIGNGTFYLEDRVTGSITDLSKDSYTVNLPEKTAGTGRFFIHTTLTTGINPVIAGNELAVRIWNNHHLVNIEGTVSAKATGAIYDLLGRQLLQTRLNDSQFNTITVLESLKGIYLVKVVDGEKIATRKVVF